MNTYSSIKSALIFFGDLGDVTCVELAITGSSFRSIIKIIN